jgi:hypothetical protein
MSETYQIRETRVYLPTREAIMRYYIISRYVAKQIERRFGRAMNPLEVEIFLRETRDNRQLEAQVQ